MKIVKLDRRYAGATKWAYAMQFSNRGKQGKLERMQYAKAFNKLFGPDRYLNPDKNISVFSRDWYLWNENWVNDTKRNRIYFNSEGDVSAVTLLLEYR